MPSVITTAEAREHLGGISTMTAPDQMLQSFIDRAEDAITNRIGPLQSTPVTERVRGWCTTLRLSVTPLISVTSVTSIEGTTVPTAQLTVLPGGRVTFKQYGYFPSRFYDVVVEAGRATLDDDLRLAILERIRYFFESKRGGAGRVRGGELADERAAEALARSNELIEPHLPMLGA